MFSCREELLKQNRQKYCDARICVVCSSALARIITTGKSRGSSDISLVVSPLSTLLLVYQLMNENELNFKNANSYNKHFSPHWSCRESADFQLKTIEIGIGNSNEISTRSKVINSKFVNAELILRKIQKPNKFLSLFPTIKFQ